MPGVREKKNWHSNLKFFNRIPTHRTNIRIIEYSGPALPTSLDFKISTPPIHCHYIAWKSQDIFKITLIVFIWNKKVIYTSKCKWCTVNDEVIFIFGWTIPLTTISLNIWFGNPKVYKLECNKRLSCWLLAKLSIRFSKKNSRKHASIQSDHDFINYESLYSSCLKDVSKPNQSSVNVFT